MVHWCPVSAGLNDSQDHKNGGSIWGAVRVFILCTKYLFYILNIHSIFHVFVLYFKCLFNVLNIYPVFQIYICSIFQKLASCLS